MVRRSFLAEGGAASESSAASNSDPEPLIDFSAGIDEPLNMEFERLSLVTRTEGVVKEAFAEEFAKTRAELQTLYSTNKELLDGQEEIGAIEAELDSKLAVISGCVQDLEKEQSELAAWIAALDNLDPEALDPDTGILNPQDPVHKQLVRAFAHDASIDDAIYHLGDALRHGLFPSFDVYMKKVRNLSREQFYIRATILKCRQKAGLDEDTS